MKRDLDLQTKILQRLGEAGPNDEIRAVDGYPHHEFCYHARQLERAGLIDLLDVGDLSDSLDCIPTGLTPEGHRVLEEAKTSWQRKATSVGGQAAQITFDTVLRGILAHIIP